MKNTMKTAKLFGAVALMLVVGLMAATPANAYWTRHPGPGPRPGWHDDWHGHPGYWGHARPYGYVAAPPVVYAPPPRSGVSLFFPIHIN